MDTNSLLDLIHERRSIRRYTEDDISNEQLEALLDAASVAPSRLDRRPLHYMIIRSPETKALLADALRVRPYIQQAPIVIAVCGDPKISNVWEMDGSAAIENILLAATALGLGATWVGSKGSEFWARAVESLRTAVALPAGIEIVSLVCVGYPAEEKAPYQAGERIDRARLHYDHWDSLQL